MLHYPFQTLKAILPDGARNGRKKGEENMQKIRKRKRRNEENEREN
jgi:hypothetical protein